MRRPLTALLLMVVSACSSGAGVITANEEGQSLSRINAAGEVTTLPVPIMPHNVQVSTGGQWILATGMAVGEHGQHHAAGGALLMVKAESFSPSDVEVMPLGDHLAHVITDATGKTAYITDSASNVVLVVDLSARKLMRTIPTGKFPHGMRMNPQRDELYTANVKDGTVSVIDPRANRETHRIQVGGKPIQVAVTPDGNKLYITLAKDSAVAVVNLTSYSKVKSIPVPHAPAQVYADPKGRYIYTANQGNEKNPGNTLSVIDVATDNVLKTIVTGRMPHGVVASGDGKFIYVTNMGEDTVSQLETEGLTVTKTYRVGAAPNGITLTEAQGWSIK